MKVVFTALALLLATATYAAWLSSSAHAVQPGTMTGGNKTHGGGPKAKCPPGTCSKAGTSWAQDVSYCSAANCKK